MNSKIEKKTILCEILSVVIPWIEFIFYPYSSLPFSFKSVIVNNYKFLAYSREFQNPVNEFNKNIQKWGIYVSIFNK